MQVQTTTTTTENVSALGANFQIVTFEQTITAFCDTCANNANGTITALENQGWHLGRNEQFCSECN